MSGGRHRATLRHRAPGYGRRIAGRRSRRAMVLAGLASTALVAGVGGAGTFAFWTDAQQLEGQQFRAGTLDLQAGPDAGSTYSWTALGMLNMAPGESVSAEVELRNAGSTPFTMRLSGSATGTLSQYVTVTVKTGATASPDASAYPRQETCEGGTQRFAGAVGATPAAVDLGSLSPAATTRLCVVISLPQAALNEAQRADMIPTYTIAATQAP